MKRNKLVKIKACVLCIICMVAFFESSPMHAAESDNAFLNQQTKIEIVVQKGISPGVLPGGKEPDGTNQKEFSVSKQISYQSARAAFLPKTGSTRNNWILIGMLLLATVFLYIKFNKRKTEAS
ncbi:LPXTG cell wall anchor domain-containing protein [Candidatus Enterococcus avicola]